MKNIMLVISAGTLLLASCSLNNAFLKRKYTKGIFLESVSSKTGKVKINDMTVHSAVCEKNVSIFLNRQATQISPQTDNLNPQRIVAQYPSTTQNAKKQSFLLQTENKNIRSFIEQNDWKEYSGTFKWLPLSFKQLAQSRISSDNDKIVWIILSLFPILCLIAIYLHDGKKITNNFWIDLILHITFLGEIIFALLVVLDIINLA